MKGLILKDLYVSAKYFRNYIFILLIFLAASVFQGNSLFFVFYPIMICGMLPVNLLAFDERFRWDIYCGTLPVTRDMVVSSKYLLSLMAQGVIFLIIAVIQAVRISLQGPFDPESYLMLLGLLFITSLVSSSVTMPFMFKLGVEKGRLAYYAMIGLVLGASYGFGSVFNDQLRGTIPLGLILIPGCLGAAAIFGLSWYLSIRFYRRRELY